MLSNRANSEYYQIFSLNSPIFSLIFLSAHEWFTLKFKIFIEFRQGDMQYRLSLDFLFSFDVVVWVTGGRGGGGKSVGTEVLHDS